MTSTPKSWWSPRPESTMFSCTWPWSAWWPATTTAPTPSPWPWTCSLAKLGPPWPWLWTCHPHPRGTQQMVSGAACCTWMQGSAWASTCAPGSRSLSPGSSQPKPRSGASSAWPPKFPVDFPCQSSRDPRARCHLLEQDCIFPSSFGAPGDGTQLLYLTGLARGQCCWPGVSAADPFLQNPLGPSVFILSWAQTLYIILIHSTHIYWASAPCQALYRAREIGANKIDPLPILIYVNMWEIETHFQPLSSPLHGTHGANLWEGVQVYMLRELYSLMQNLSGTVLGVGDPARNKIRQNLQLLPSWWSNMLALHYDCVWPCLTGTYGRVWGGTWWWIIKYFYILWLLCSVHLLDNVSYLQASNCCVP